MNATSEYIKAIREMLALEGRSATNLANHRMLETKQITLDMFRAAAQVMVQDILKDEYQLSNQGGKT